MNVLSRPQPSCPACGWTLAFEAVDGVWVAFCWNKPPINPCPVGTVPPGEHETKEALQHG